ncbi:MAG: N-acetyl-gamma-glutamyl-phosphate reductase [Firmicutes bacterium]|nr:N-acetyl-gamma-glutamyl-phosphate reductase [Bacillota bacterium]
MVKAAIRGGAGYTGGELVRLLLGHPEVEMVGISSRSHAGLPLGKAWPQFRGYSHLVFAEGEPLRAAEKAEVVFLAMGQGEAMELVPRLVEEGKKIIDLGPDFRFRDPGTYTEWYGKPHTCPDLTTGAAYGLPELWRTEIKDAKIVGNPGCYPTAALLALAPLAAAGLIDPETIVIDAKSGYSGAGRQPVEGYQFAEAFGDFRAYGLPRHRHLPEIEGGLARFFGREIKVTFIPHLVPMARGIFLTAVAELTRPCTTEEVLGIMARFYPGEPFVHVLDEKTLPQTKAVLGTNYVQLGARVDPRTGRVVVMAVLDNLGKGAAGQAVQNMNLLFGLEETAGLTATAVYP